MGVGSRLKCRGAFAYLGIMRIGVNNESVSAADLVGEGVKLGLSGSAVRCFRGLI